MGTSVLRCWKVSIRGAPRAGHWREGRQAWEGLMAGARVVRPGLLGQLKLCRNRLEGCREMERKSSMRGKCGFYLCYALFGSVLLLVIFKWIIYTPFLKFYSTTSHGVRQLCLSSTSFFSHLDLFSELSTTLELPTPLPEEIRQPI